MNLKQFATLLSRYNESPLSLPKERLDHAIALCNPEPDVVAALVDSLELSWADVSQTVLNYREYSAQGKREALAEKIRSEANNKADQAVAALREVQRGLLIGTDISDQHIARSLNNAQSCLESILPKNTIKDPFFSISNYFSRVSDYKPEDQFRPALFNGLPFPKGTTSYVGARTGRGKSASLINLTREALNDNKKVLFITLELSNFQIFNRLILSKQKELGGAINHKDFQATLPSWCKSPDGQVNTLPAINFWMNELAKQISGASQNSKPPLFPPGFLKSVEYNRDAVTSGQLTIADVRGFSLSRIIQTIREIDAEIVFLDYVQKLPSVEYGRTDGYQRLQDVSQRLVDVSVQTNRIIIAAAQFNRMGSVSGSDDTFSDSSFREAGDLEQDAHNAVGIGWPANKEGRFYEVLKARESHHTGQSFSLEWDGAHGYMANVGKYYKSKVLPITSSQPNRELGKRSVSKIQVED